MSEKINFRFVQLAAQTAPSITVDRKSEIVGWGADNKFPNYVLDLSIQSSLHTAILDRKVKMGCGEGFTYDGGTNSKTDKFLENPNPYESMDDLLQKTYWDLEIFGGFAFQIIWAKDKKNIAEIYHCPFQNIRSGKANKMNQIEEYFYCEEWTKYTRISDTQRFPAFSDFGDKKQTQILYCKQYSPTNYYYPMPSYIGGINDINTLYEISIFHNACITNNFQPGIIITFRGPIPTPEEQDFVMKALTDKYKGSKNAGTPAVFFLDSEQQAPTITQTSVSDLDKQYMTLTEAVKESVVMAHSMPRLIAGLEKAGSLGGGKEYVDANSIFMNNYVEKNQQFLLRWYNKIMDINGLKELNIINSAPSIMLYDTGLMTQVMTKNEIRETFGMEALDDDGTNENDEKVIKDETTETGEKITEETNE